VEGKGKKKGGGRSDIQWNFERLPWEGKFPFFWSLTFDSRLKEKKNSDRGPRMIGLREGMRHVIRERQFAKVQSS